MAKRQQQNPFDNPEADQAPEPDPAVPAEPIPGEPVPAGAGTEPPANAAAPLEAAARRGPTGVPIAQHVAVGAVLDERHIGIVDEEGHKVDLESALERDSENSSNRRATKRIYEETTVPGGEEGDTRRRLLFGENATVPEAVYQQLCEAVKTNQENRKEQEKGQPE